MFLPLPRPEFFGKLVVMPKKTVTECACDRCHRVWYEEVKSEEGLVPPGASLKLWLRPAHGEPTEVNYDLLCEGCEKAVRNYITNIHRDLKPVSKAKKDAAEATPPIGTPTKKK